MTLCHKMQQIFSFRFFILHVNLVLLNIFISENSMFKTAKLNPLLPSSIATRNSFFQTERVQGSFFDDHTRHFPMLFPNLKYIVSIFCIIPINPSADLFYILYLKHILLLILTNILLYFSLL